MYHKYKNAMNVQLHNKVVACPVIKIITNRDKRQIEICTYIYLNCFQLLFQKTVKPLGIYGLLWNSLLTKVSSVAVQDRNVDAVGEAPHVLIPSFLWLSWSVNFGSHSFFSHTWSSYALLIFSTAPHPLVVITLNFIRGGVPYTLLSLWPPVRNLHWRARLAFLPQKWMLRVGRRCLFT